jgi:hypothetical protein
VAVEDDGSDVVTWAQSPLRQQGDPAQGYDDGTSMAQKLAVSAKPLLTKEIYAGFQDVSRLSQFFLTFYEKSHAGGSTGLVVQHLPLIRREDPFRITWLSESGAGNRDTLNGQPQFGLPNWSDPSLPAWQATAYSTLFAGLYRSFAHQSPVPAGGEISPELLVTGLLPDDFAVLLPRDPSMAPPPGVRAAADGTAWMVAEQPGEYDLVTPAGSMVVRLAAQRLPRQPGYDYVQRVAAQTPAPKRTAYQYGSMDWVCPGRAEPQSMHYRTFFSAKIQGDVSYLIYLPLDYEQQTGVRYPVLYDLPASGQTSKSAAEVARCVDQSIRAGTHPACIRMICDSATDTLRLST